MRYHICSHLYIMDVVMSRGGCIKGVLVLGWGVRLVRLGRLVILVRPITPGFWLPPASLGAPCGFSVPAPPPPFYMKPENGCYHEHCMQSVVVDNNYR